LVEILVAHWKEKEKSIDVYKWDGKKYSFISRKEG